MLLLWDGGCRVQAELLSLGRNLVGRHTYSWCCPNVIILDCFIVSEVMKPGSVCLVCVTPGWARLGWLLLTKKKENGVCGASSPEGLLWGQRRECLFCGGLELMISACLWEKTKLLYTVSVHEKKAVTSGWHRV